MFCQTDDKKVVAVESGFRRGLENHLAIVLLGLVDPKDDVLSLVDFAFDGKVFTGGFATHNCD